MGREVRRTPLDWKHPKHHSGARDGDYRPLFEGHNFKGEPNFETDLAAFKLDPEDFDEEPNAYDYMPAWTPEQAVGWQMYENVSEGTPISPVFETAEELARYLADRPINEHGWFTRNSTYEVWLGMIHRGSAPSMVVEDERPMSGVEWVGQHAKDNES